MTVSAPWALQLGAHERLNERRKRHVREIEAASPN